MARHEGMSEVTIVKAETAYLTKKKHCTVGIAGIGIEGLITQALMTVIFLAQVVTP